MNMSLEETITYLNKERGVWGLSGVSSDFRDLWTAQQEGNERAETALKVFCRKLKKTIGSYAAVMGGVDAIIFTAGIGENDHKVREWSVEGLQFLGAHLNYEYNADNEHVYGKDMKFSTDDSTVEIWCIPTNEELAIAKETYRLCK